MTAEAHCPICLDHFRIDADKPEFVVFPCGHGLCESCTDQLFPTLESTAKCPNCRKSIRQRDGHPVYLELVDSKLAVPTELIEGFGKMNADTPLSSLKEASVKLGQVSKETSDRVVSLLQKVIEDLIIPNFTTVENQKQEIESLCEELIRNHQERDSIQTEVVSLRNALSESEANTQEAIRLAEVAEDDLRKVHERSGQWQRRAAELEEQNKHLKDMLELHASIGRLQEEANCVLREQLAAMREERAEAEKATVSLSDVLTHIFDLGDLFGREDSRSQSSPIIISSPVSRKPSPPPAQPSRALLPAPSQAQASPPGQTLPPGALPPRLFPLWGDNFEIWPETTSKTTWNFDWLQQAGCYWKNGI